MHPIIKKTLKSITTPLAITAILGSFAFAMASVDTLNQRTAPTQTAQAYTARKTQSAEVISYEETKEIEKSTSLFPNISFQFKKANPGILQLPPTPPAGTPPVIGSFLVNGSTTPSAVDYEDIFTATWNVTGADYCEGRGYHIPTQSGGDWMSGNPLATSGVITNLIAKEGSQNGYSPWLPLTLFCVTGTPGTSSYGSSYQTIHLPVNEPEDEILLMGGMSNSYMNDVWKSNDGINWTLISPHDSTATNKWSPRMSHEAVYFNNKYWVLGGSLIGDVWSSPDGVSWTLVTSTAPWNGRVGHKVVSYGGYMWLMGGIMSINGVFSEHMNDVWKSNNGISWTLVSPQNVNATNKWLPRNYPGLVVLDGKLTIFGGSNSSIYPQDVWQSVNGATWGNVTNVIWGAGNERRNFEAITFDGEIITSGAEGGQGFAPASEIWRTANGSSWNITATLSWLDRKGHGMFEVDDKLFIAGGLRTYSSSLNDIWSSLDGATWINETMNAPWSARWHHKIVSREVKEIIPY